jgi:hypothetical protein
VASNWFPVSWRRGNDEHGVALVLTLMSMVLLLTLGGALVAVTATETTIAARFRDGLGAFYAADAGIAWTMAELRGADWNEIRAGNSSSSLSDGSVDLRAATRDLEAIADTLNLQPYAYGRLSDLLPGAAADARLWVVVWVAADPVGDDKLIVVRSHAYGPAGVRRMVETTLRQNLDGPRVAEWREGS